MKKTPLNRKIKKKNGIILLNSFVRKSKLGWLYCVTEVMVENRRESLYFWKRDLNKKEWLLAINLKKKDLISFQGKQWGGGWNGYHLAKKSKKIAWSTIEKEIENSKLAFIDIETTTSRIGENEIVEIAYLVCQNQKVILQKSFLIKPRKIKNLKNVNHYANIKIEELKKASEFEKVLPDIQKDLDGAIIISHNLKGFDYHCLQKNGFFQKDLTYYFFDTLPASRKLIKEKNWNQKSDLQSLIMKIRNDENFQEEHRALPDALLHKELFDYLIKDKKEILLLYRIH